MSPNIQIENNNIMVLLFTTLGVRLNERVSYHRLASIYFILEQYEMAENYYLKALSLSPTALEHGEYAHYYVKVYCRLANLTLHKLKVPSHVVIFYQFEVKHIQIFC